MRTGTWLALPIGVAYWWAVARWSGVGEPWDAARYWSVAYPGALVLAAAIGWWRPGRAWGSGATLVLAQLPVAIAAGGADALLLAGFVVALVLAIPAMLVAAAAGWIRARGAR